MKILNQSLNMPQTKLDTTFESNIFDYLISFFLIFYFRIYVE